MNCLVRVRCDTDATALPDQIDDSMRCGPRLSRAGRSLSEEVRGIRDRPPQQNVRCGAESGSIKTVVENGLRNASHCLPLFFRIERFARNERARQGITAVAGPLDLEKAIRLVD